MSEEKFNDPLEKLDPIMESAFSTQSTPPETNIDATTTDATPSNQSEASDEFNRFFESDEAFRTEDPLLDDAPNDSDDTDNDDRVPISQIDFGAPIELSAPSQFDKELFKNKHHGYARPSLFKRASTFGSLPRND